MSAQMSCERPSVRSSDPLHLRFRCEWVDHIDIAAANISDIARDQDKAMDASRSGKGAVALVFVLGAEQP